MVQRYNQPNLPSLVVGTPGVDPSAGAAAGAVAKASENANAGAMQFANQQFNQAKEYSGQAKADYSQATSHFANAQYMGAHAAAEIQAQRQHQQAQQAATRNLQNSLLASNAKIDQQTVVDNAVAQVKAQSLGDPYSAPDNFTKQVIPQLKQQLMGQYADPYTQKVMLPQINSMLESGRGDLQSWAPRAVTEQVDGQLKAIPAKLTTAVGNIDPMASVADQLSSYHKIMADGLTPYQTLKTQSQMIPGKGDQIDAAALNLKQVAGKQFVQNGISSIPDDANGLTQYNQWKQVLEHSDKFGLQLGGDDRSSLLSQLNTQKNQSIKTQVDGIQSDTQISVANIKVQQAYLAENFQNPKIRDQIMGSMHDNLTNLQAQLKQVQGKKAVPGSPEESIKKQQLISINQQMGQILGAENQGLKETNSYEALQRNLVSFSHSMTTFAQGQIKFVQGQTQFMQGQEKFQQGQEDRKAKTGHIEAVTNYNGQMQGFFANNIKVLGMPLGPERLKAAQDQSTGMMSTADAAFKTGAINANQYAAVSKQAKDLINMSQYKHSDGLWGWGAGNKPIQKPQDRVNAAMDSAHKTAQASALAQQDLGTIQTLSKMAGHMATNEHESAIVQKYVNTHGPEIINEARRKGYTDAQIQQRMPQIVGGALTRFRKGDLH